MYAIRSYYERIAVAGNAEIGHLAIGRIGAGRNRRHAPVHRVESMRAGQEIGRCFRRAADAGELDDPLRRHRQLPESLHDRGGNGVVAATGAQGRQRAFVITLEQADFVPLLVR